MIPGKADPPSTPVKSFARRARPQQAFPKLKWECIKAAFNTHVRQHVEKPSAHEDRKIQKSPNSYPLQIRPVVFITKVSRYFIL